MTPLVFFRNAILPIKDINSTLPEKGLIYELGSGYGTLAFEIARYRSTRQVVAIDVNQKKISEAKRDRTMANLKYVKGDVLSFPYTSFMGVVMSDFLHHINYPSQEILIRSLSQMIKKDGVLVIKEIDKDDGWRRILSRLWDWVLYPSDEIYYRSKKEWLILLRSKGFAVKVSRKSVFFPGSTHLYICTKNS